MFIKTNVQKYTSPKMCFFLIISSKHDQRNCFLPQTQIFGSLYLCNLMVQTFDISNLHYLSYKEIEVRKLEFVTKTQSVILSNV